MRHVLLALGLGAATLVLGTAAQAQGIFRGAEIGAARGERAAGPIGGIIGGALGAGIGGVNGALGIRPTYRRVYHAPRRSYYRRTYRNY